MAITPKWDLISEGRLYDADSSTSVHIIVDAGSPSGAADPQASANMGSLYFRTDQSDDKSPLYIKIDSDSSDNDWVQVLIASGQDTPTINGSWTFGTDYGLYFRDTGQRIYSPAANVGALALAASSDYWRFGDMSGSNYLQLDYYGELTYVGGARINPRAMVEVFDDFFYQAGFTEADHPWILNEGTDGAATDPAISAQERGVIQCVTGAGDGTVAEDGSQLVCAVPVQADSGGLIFETRLHINTAITNVAVNAGLTDNTGLEEPFSIAAGDAITSHASDAVCFCYDSSADTDEWFALATDSDGDDAGNATTGTAPVADIYQKLRIEVNTTGAQIKYYIDGTLETTLTGDAGVSPDANLYATVIACGDGTASKSVDVDYIYVGVKR